MATTSSTTGTSASPASLVTALGGGSGVDMTALANNLAMAQFAGRTKRLDALNATLERQISSASALKSQTLQLASALGDRIRSGDLAQRPTVANPAVATATTAAGVAAGSYTLEVTRLASAQTISAPAFPSRTSAPGAGTLTFRFGTTNGTAFADDAARPPVTVPVASGATLSDIAGAINKAGAGISAYIAQTSGGAQLVLKGKDGAANSFVVDVAETAGNEGLSALAFHPATAGAERIIAPARDAAFRLDGLDMTSSSNTVSNVAPGLSLELLAVNVGTPTTIRFSNPAEAITGAMQDFTSALNELASDLAAKVDPKTGDLARDDGARAFRTELTKLAGTVLMPNAPAGSPRTLADLGLATNRDGTFRLDGDRLRKTLASSPEGASAMFTTGLFGIYSTMDKLARSVSRTSDSRSLSGSIARYTALKARTGEDLSRLADKQAALRTNLMTRFAGTDARVGASRATLSFLQNQIDAWNKG